MTLEFVLFVILATVIVTSALGVVLSASIVRSAVFLLITLIGISFLYFLLGAEFLGATQLIVYVGGTLVLLVFGGMLTSGGPFHYQSIRRSEWIIASVVAVFIFFLLVQVSLSIPLVANERSMPGPGALGLAFLTSHLLPFEIVSVHLLVVLIGAAYLARAKKKTRSVL